METPLPLMVATRIINTMAPTVNLIPGYSQVGPKLKCYKVGGAASPYGTRRVATSFGLEMLCATCYIGKNASINGWHLLNDHGTYGQSDTWVLSSRF